MILSWITNASFAASIKGRVVLLDTFVTRLEVAARAHAVHHPGPGRPEARGALPRPRPLRPRRQRRLPLEEDRGDHLRLAGDLRQHAARRGQDLRRRLDGPLRRSHLTRLDPRQRAGDPPSARAGGDASRPSSTSTPPTPRRRTRLPPMVINTPDAGVCAPPCNLADPRDPAMFPAGTPLSTVLDIATSRAGQGGPISIYYVVPAPRRERVHLRLAQHQRRAARGLRAPEQHRRDQPAGPSQPGQDAKGCFGPDVGQQS